MSVHIWKAWAVPALHLLSRVDLCIPQQHYRAQLPSYPTVLPQPTVVYFDLLAVRPKEMEKAVLTWQKPNFSDYLILNKTRRAFATQLSEDRAAAVMINLDSCNSSAYFEEPKNC